MKLTIDDRFMGLGVSHFRTGPLRLARPVSFEQSSSCEAPKSTKAEAEAQAFVWLIIPGDSLLKAPPTMAPAIFTPSRSIS
ncbi:hypothetical protein [Rhizobium freirei]|uniref:hypothetical protein n=1 Tax=Rhizobium freirei TaxID=1353277 RepID=UPI0012FC58CD|nr:hypothetical protein [Rhizobium freirei]